MKTFRRNRIEITLFFLLLASSVYIFPRWADWSQNSRLDLTLAIVDQGTLAIDAYYSNTGDYALFEGKHYSDKAPGPSFLAVPVYAAVRPILHSAPVQRLLEKVAASPAFAATLQEGGSGLASEKIYTFLVLYLVTFFTSALPSALLGVLLYRFLQHIGVSVGWAVSIAVIYGLATNAFAYSGAFFSHQLVAFLLFGAFYLGYRIKSGARSPRWSILAGFMLAYAVISEYPAALIGAGIFVYIALNLPDRRWIVGLIAGGLPPALLLMGYDYAIFHTILPVGYQYSELYVGEAGPHSTGFLSLTYPHLDAILGITFGSFRGLFYVSPVLALAVLGLALGWREKRLRPEWAVLTWATLSFFLFYASSAMWQGGFSVGPRYLVPMVSFLSIGLGALALRWGNKLWLRLLTGFLAVWSLAVVWLETLGGQNYPDWTPNPLLNYSLPRWVEGDIARNAGMALGLKGIASLLPLAIILALLGVWLARTLLKGGLRPPKTQF